jgi:type II secretory pathway pseudopilin PulG
MIYANDKNKSGGFSTVELLVTIIVAAIFAIALSELSILSNSVIASARQKSVASELAYSYLRQYTGADSTPAYWFTCSTASGSSNTNDYTVNPNAAGQTLMSGDFSNYNGLVGQVTYSVTALAFYGCSGANAGTPIKISAKVTYGINNSTVEHSTLVNY